MQVIETVSESPKENHVVFAPRWVGRLSYAEGLDLQKKAVENVRKLGFIEILGLEHENVITLGRRADFQNHVEWSWDDLLRRGVEVVQASRGGHATLHSPGQLVIYPIANLQSLAIGVRDFVEVLEKSTIEVCKALGVEAFRREGSPGVFTRRGKIAFVGLRVERGISSHGLSFNVSNDLTLFESIRPCNAMNSDRALDSLCRYRMELKVEEVFQLWIQNFRELLTQTIP